MTNRAEFFTRLEPFHTPSALIRIQLAYTLAKFSHRAQVRKEKDLEGKPVRYFEHVKRVALILMDEGKFYNEELVISALLHDGLEDTRDITPELLEQVFGQQVALTVKTLSKVPKDGYLERFVLCEDIGPYIIKACDRLDNLRTLSSGSLEFQRKQVQETRDKYYPLFDLMVELSRDLPSTSRRNVQHLRDLVIRTTEQFRIVE